MRFSVSSPVLAEHLIITGFFHVHHFVGFLHHFADGFRDVLCAAVANRAAVFCVGDVLPDTLDQLEHVIQGAFPADDQELVPADAVDGLVGFGGLGETQREGGQRFVSGGMAVGVVDVLQAVHVYGNKGGDSLRICFHVSVAGLAVQDPGE